MKKSLFIISLFLGISLCSFNLYAKNEGAASYYHNRFNGSRTASGETFNNAKLTAAHRTLPFGTRLKVTNLRNGRSVIVRVNDRGPYSHGRVLDISRAAAQQIGMVATGTARVRYEVVNGNNQDDEQQYVVAKADPKVLASLQKNKKSASKSKSSFSSQKKAKQEKSKKEKKSSKANKSKEPKSHLSKKADNKKTNSKITGKKANSKKESITKIKSTGKAKSANHKNAQLTKQKTTKKEVHKNKNATKVTKKGKISTSKIYSSANKAKAVKVQANMNKAKVGGKNHKVSQPAKSVVNKSMASKTTTVKFTTAKPTKKSKAHK